VTKKRPVNLAKLARPTSSSPAPQSDLQVESNSGHPLAATGVVLPFGDRSDIVRHDVSRWSVGQAFEVPHGSQLRSPQTNIRSTPRPSDSSILHESRRPPSGSSSHAPNGLQDGYPLPSSSHWNSMAFMDDVKLFSSLIDYEVSRMCCVGGSYDNMLILRLVPIGRLNQLGRNVCCWPEDLKRRVSLGSNFFWSTETGRCTLERFRPSTFGRLDRSPAREILCDKASDNTIRLP